MKKMKLTIEDTGALREVEEYKQRLKIPNQPEEIRLERVEKMLELLTMSYVVVGALNTIEWRIGQHLSKNEVAEILARTGDLAVDVSVKGSFEPEED